MVVAALKTDGLLSVPPGKLVAFFVEAAVNELPIGWIRRLRSEQSLQKRMRQARDRTAYCACCGTLSRLTNDCTPSTTCGGAHNSTSRRTSDHILFRRLSTPYWCRVCPCHTLVDVPLHHIRSDTH
jgi:hypothetical protein